MKVREVVTAILDFELSTIPSLVLIIFSALLNFLKYVFSLFLSFVIFVLVGLLYLYRRFIILFLGVALYWFYENEYIVDSKSWKIESYVQLSGNTYVNVGVILSLVGMVFFYFVARRWTKKLKENNN